MIQTYGFGGIPRFQGGQNDGTVSHFFPCSGNHVNSSGLGTKGVFELYQMAKGNVDLAGPTYFAPLISGVAGLV